MSRLIDADVLRKNVLNSGKVVIDEDILECENVHEILVYLLEKVEDCVVEMIDEQPTVEAKPVIHCKDCEHWGTGVAGETEHVKCCEYGKYMVGENGYCCYADMRGGKNE